MVHWFTTVLPNQSINLYLKHAINKKVVKSNANGMFMTIKGPFGIHAHVRNTYSTYQFDYRQCRDGPMNDKGPYNYRRGIFRKVKLKLNCHIYSPRCRTLSCFWPTNLRRPFNAQLYWYIVNLLRQTIPTKQDIKRYRWQRCQPLTPSTRLREWDCFVCHT
jgi:hypothetical protein